MKYIESSGKSYLHRIIILLLLLLFNLTGISQNKISERKKIRYLKKIERKNERYVRQQEKKTKRLLIDLSSKEKKLLNKVDSISTDSTIIKTNFSKISDRFDEELNSDPKFLVERLSQPVKIQKSISISVSGNCFIHQCSD